MLCCVRSCSGTRQDPNMRWAGTIKSITLTTLPRSSLGSTAIVHVDLICSCKNCFLVIIQNRISENRRGRLSPFFRLSHADTDRGCPLWNWGDASILYASVSLSYGYLSCWICKVHPPAFSSAFLISRCRWSLLNKRLPKKPPKTQI